MTKKEFINKFAAKLGTVQKKDAERYVTTFLETVEESLVAGEPVSFIGWGKWEVVHREAREVRNPQSGEKMKVPAKKVVKFRVGKVLENKVASVPEPKAKAAKPKKNKK